MIQLLLFAYAISFDVDATCPPIVIDLDRTPASQRYLRHYEASPFFDVVAPRGSSLADVDAAFDRNTARVAIVIPSGFARTLAAGDDRPGRGPGGRQRAQRGQGRRRPTPVALNQLYSQQLTRAWADAQGLDLSSLGMLRAAGSAPGTTPNDAPPTS